MIIRKLEGFKNEKMTLKKYNEKRHFASTPEPEGIKQKTKSKSKPRFKFVIQKHAASHLHYDFRLEIKGVLKSWAVPKGPSTDPSIKRLAVEVEDHPMDYGDFEGIIPAKQYGAGTVMVWDTGYWLCDIDPHRAYKEGKINIFIHGKKLQGLWKLIRIKSRNENDTKNTWLLMNAQDEYAQAGDNILVMLPKSALSGRTMDEIAKNLKKKSKSIKSKSIILKQAKKSKIPRFLAPELSFLVNTPPSGDNWLHEIKYDGYRLLCFIQDKEIRLITRNGKDWTDQFSVLIKEIKKLKLNNAILDGEVVAIENNIMSFQSLQSFLKGTANPRLVYFIFDIPYANDFNLCKVPLIQRKEYLQSIFKNIGVNSHIAYSEFIRGHGEQVYQEASKAGFEGIVSKQYDSFYESKRSHAWLKTKCSKRQEFVIGGYTLPKNSREGFGALLLGYYDNAQRLIYCGKVGTGFNSLQLNEYLKLFSKHASKKSFFSDNTRIVNKKDIVWLKPKCIAEIQFTEFTEDNILRHPSFIGLRQDKKSKEVFKENVITVPIILTHPEKILYPKTNTSKLDLVHYYEHIQEWILPYVINRPLSVLRCPANAQKTCFFQKHPHKNFSEHVYAVDIKTDKEHYIYIKNIEGLLSLVQANVLEIHPWGSTIDKLEKPDQITFDLDPGPMVDWKTIIKSSFLNRDALHSIHLESFVKTSGRKGLHIVVPITSRLEWPEIKEFAKYFSVHVSQLYPELFISNMSKHRRTHKIYVDYLRNGRGATSVCAYSTRVGERPTISTPLDWDELKSTQSADYYDLYNIIKRLDSKTDPWQAFHETPQSITKRLIIKLKNAIG